MGGCNAHLTEAENASVVYFDAADVVAAVCLYLDPGESAAVASISCEGVDSSSEDAKEPRCFWSLDHKTLYDTASVLTLCNVLGKASKY